MPLFGTIKKELTVTVQGNIKRLERIIPSDMKAFGRICAATNI